VSLQRAALRLERGNDMMEHRSQRFWLVLLYAPLMIFSQTVIVPQRTKLAAQCRLLTIKQQIRRGACLRSSGQPRILEPGISTIATLVMV